ncbi:MAG: hypothetical protein M1816_006457 [Peltula sp. TS41687]|nr:MAG: hypothetical protein M1816_006457 [Peltula sp. TS41687]
MCGLINKPGLHQQGQASHVHAALIVRGLREQAGEGGGAGASARPSSDQVGDAAENRLHKDDQPEEIQHVDPMTSLLDGAHGFGATPAEFDCLVPSGRVIDSYRHRLGPGGNPSRLGGSVEALYNVVAIGVEPAGLNFSEFFRSSRVSTARYSGRNDPFAFCVRIVLRIVQEEGLKVAAAFCVR